MAPAPQLAPPGSSSYSSNTLHVGDGTWDAGRDTFLLPNLVGLNFETMRYNGMGNRFAGLAGYKNLIKGHAIIATITFLVIVPSAILIARFYSPQPRLALRTHIWLQIMTVILSTVAIILGFVAVGPSRNLTNPHHGIGLAIYVLILAQALFGWYVHSREKDKLRTWVPIKVMIHQYFGRLIALLGIVQVPLGLTLYGSPLYLFVLYAVFMFVLLLLYFVLSYRHEGPVRSYDGSYDSRSEVVPDRSDHRHNRLGGLAASGAAGAAIATLLRRNRSRSRSRVDVVGSHRPSTSHVDEKHSVHTEDRRNGTWRDRAFKIAATVGGLALAKRFFDRRNHSDHSSYDYSTTEDSYSRVEDGRTPAASTVRPPRQPNRLHRRSHSMSSLSSRTSVSGHGHQPSRKVSDGLVAAGAFGAFRNFFKGRRDRREQERLEFIRQRELEEERIARQDSERQRYTGDGFPRRVGRRGSLTESSTTISGAHGGTRHHHGIPGPAASGGLAAPVVADAARRSGPTVSHNVSGPLDMPQVVHDPALGSGSEMYDSEGGRRHRRHHRGAEVAPAIAAAAGPSTPHPLRSGESVNSPPVSVKVKINNDGRQVTLRRLSEQEAAAEKESRRKARHSKHRRHRQGGSGSTLSGGDAAGERWRRTEERERQEAAELQRENELAAQRRAEGGAAGLPPPPPIGGGTFAGPSSVGSPGTVTGTYDGTNTEASEYANNRRRRRAERAVRNSGRNTGGGTVDYN